MPQTKYIRWIPAPDMIKRIDKIHRVIYRCTFGLVGGRVDGLDILLLTTRGKKTGRARTVTLPFFRAGSRWLLVASFGGHPKNPAWFENLVVNPEIRVQRGYKRWSTHAHVPVGSEREKLWSELTREFPRYAIYQQRTSREIPLVAIEPPRTQG
jgi:deazaflavin-dependent oxidoreductase (nitroreductase family)